MNSSSFFKRISVRTIFTATAFTASLLFSGLSNATTPLKVGYSDWPGGVAWQVAIEHLPAHSPS